MYLYQISNIMLFNVIITPTKPSQDKCSITFDQTLIFGMYYQRTSTIDRKNVVLPWIKPIKLQCNTQIYQPLRFTMQS